MGLVVPSANPAYGDHITDVGSGHLSYRQWWGGVTSYPSWAERVLDRRHNHTSNPIQQDGFRKPSIYRRAIRRMYAPPGSVVRQINGGLGSNEVYGIPLNWDYPGVSDPPSELFPYGGELSLAPFGLQREAECLAKVYGRLQRNRVEAGLAVVEARQALAMLAKRSIDLLVLIKALKNGQFTNQLRLMFRDRKELNGVHGAFLEYQYGWKPLMSDIHDAWQAVNNKLSDLLYINASGKVEESFTDHDTWDAWLHFGFNEFGVCRIDRTREFKRTHRAKLFGKLSNEILGQMEQYGLANPLSLAWEVVPWSFVLDWWIPVGNVLSSLSAHTGLEFIGGYKSVVAEGTVTTQITPLYEWSGPGWEVKTLYRDFCRVPYTDWPWVVPYEKSPLSTTHVANALALYGSLRR